MLNSSPPGNEPFGAPTIILMRERERVCVCEGGGGGMYMITLSIGAKV